MCERSRAALGELPNGDAELLRLVGVVALDAGAGEYHDADRQHTDPDKARLDRIAALSASSSCLILRRWAAIMGPSQNPKAPHSQPGLSQTWTSLISCWNPKAGCIAAPPPTAANTVRAEEPADLARKAGSRRNPIAMHANDPKKHPTTTFGVTVEAATCCRPHPSTLGEVVVMPVADGNGPSI